MHTRAWIPATLLVAGVMTGLGALSGTASAQPDPGAVLEEVRLSGDIHARLPATGGGDAVAADEAIFTFDPDAGTAESTLPLGTLDAADLDGHDLDRFSLDVWTTIEGIAMHPADVFDAAGNHVLDARSAGIPAHVNVDAVSREPASGDLVFSIDSTASIGGNAYGPADLIRWDGSAFSPHATGLLAAPVDIDALHLAADGTVFVSLAATTMLEGQVIDPESVVHAGLAGDSLIDPQVVFTPPDASWDATDLDALWVDPFLPGTLSWGQTQVDTFEDAGAVTLTILRSGGADGDFTVNYDIIAGTAQADEDYIGIAGGQVFSDGETEDTIDIELLDNPDLDGDKEFFVELTGTTGEGTIGSPSMVTVRIIDDEDFIFADGFES